MCVLLTWCLLNFLGSWEAVGLPATLCHHGFLFLLSGILVFVFRILLSFYYVAAVHINVWFPNSFIKYIFSWISYFYIEVYGLWSYWQYLLTCLGIGEVGLHFSNPESSKHCLHGVHKVFDISFLAILYSFFPLFSKCWGSNSGLLGLCIF